MAEKWRTYHAGEPSAQAMIAESIIVRWLAQISSGPGDSRRMRWYCRRCGSTSSMWEPQPNRSTPITPGTQNGESRREISRCRPTASRADNGSALAAASVELGADESDRIDHRVHGIGILMRHLH